MLEPRAGGEDLDVRQDDLRRHVLGLRRRALRRDDVNVRAAKNVAADADDLIDSDRHGALARRDDWRQAAAGLLRRQLARQNRLVATRAVDDASGHWGGL